MKLSTSSLCTLLSAAALACGGSTPPAQSAGQAGPEAQAGQAAEPSPEQAEALAKLEEERARLAESAKAEAGRWTPELRSEAKAVAEATYDSGSAALQAALAGSYRKPGNADRDRYRHPVETFELFGFEPTMTVLEYGPGGGWYTEILAPALASSGKLLITSSDPNGPKWERSTFYGERTQAMLGAAPELYGKVELATFNPEAPALEAEGTVDLAIIIRGMHGMHNRGQVDVWLKEIHEALRPGGTLGIVQHRAKEGANPDDSSKKGYLPEAWVIEKVEAAGFELAGKSEVNANPNDTTDHPNGVWTLPPSLALGEQDRDKYLAIGESDRMTLKFTKK